MGKNGAICFALHPNRDGDDRVQIWTIGGPSSYPTQITEGTQPQISPDGTRIAFIGPDGNLFVVNADGTGQTQLTTRAAELRASYKAKVTPEEARAMDEGLVFPYSFPSWSPDGRNILYSSMEGPDNVGRPNENIYIVPADRSREPLQLTTNGPSDTYPVMTPDGRYILFLSNRGEHWAIWRIDSPAEFMGSKK